jgi:hypothetical protein
MQRRQHASDAMIAHSARRDAIGIRCDRTISATELIKRDIAHGFGRTDGQQGCLSRTANTSARFFRALFIAVPLPIMDSYPSSPVSTDDLIEAIVQSFCGDQSSAQAKHIYRESLRNLVRLAKVEQAQELQTALSHAVRPENAHFLH